MRLWFKTRGKGTFTMLTKETELEHIRSVPLRRWERKLKVLGIDSSDIVDIYHRNSVFENTWYHAQPGVAEHGRKNGLKYFTYVTPPQPVIQD